MLVVLDAGPLGLLANPRYGPGHQVHQWARGLLSSGHDLVVPAISDYEVRRELVRAGLRPALQRLDEVVGALGYLPVTAAMWHTAAELWADARRTGRPTAADAALDGDVVLAAQALTLADEDDLVVATTNTRHLERYVAAALWSEVR